MKKRPSKKRPRAHAVEKTIQTGAEPLARSPESSLVVRASFFFRHIPNALSIVRAAGAPLSVWLIGRGQLTLAFWVFFAVCITDWLDGFLARRWQAVSKLGQILDPLADKILLMSLYLALGAWNYIPLWAAVAVLIRDFFILSISGIILLTRRNAPISLAPHFMGKLSTACQMLFMGLALGGGATVLSVPTPSIKSIVMIFFFYAMVLTTILSGITYARVALKALRAP